MDELYKVLGWKGGTIHQIVAEIERLKKIEIAAYNLLIKELINNVTECKRFIKKSAQKGNYTDAIKLQGMIDAYEHIKEIIEFRR